MNKITQLFLSTLVLSGFAYGMDQQMSREEFSNKFNQFKNFSLTPTNKDEFGTLYKDLMKHIDHQDPIYRSFKGMINGIRTEKMQMLPQEFIDYNGVNRPRNQLNAVKKKLFQPHTNPEFAMVLPSQYVLNAQLGVVKNNNNEN